MKGDGMKVLAVDDNAHSLVSLEAMGVRFCESAYAARDASHCGAATSWRPGSRVEWGESEHLRMCWAIPTRETA